MTIDYLKDLLFDVLNEDRVLNLRALHWDGDRQCFELTTEDGSSFVLRCEAAK